MELLEYGLLNTILTRISARFFGRLGLDSSKVASCVFKNESRDDERPWSIQKPCGQLT
jgi:hypothetical protein